jgi:hypothetical protein
MHEPSELDSEEETIVCLVEMYDVQPMHARVSWFLLNHFIDNLGPSIVAVAVLKRVLK